MPIINYQIGSMSWSIFLLSLRCAETKVLHSRRTMVYAIVFDTRPMLLRRQYRPTKLTSGHVKYNDSVDASGIRSTISTALEVLYEGFSPLDNSNAKPHRSAQTINEASTAAFLVGANGLLNIQCDIFCSGQDACCIYP